MAGSSEERALRLWASFRGDQAHKPLEPGASLAERLASGARNVSKAGYEPLVDALDDLASGLPLPVADLDLLPTRSPRPAGPPFAVSGLPLPAMSEAGKSLFHYIQCWNGQHTTLSAAFTTPGEALCVLLVGKVHYRSGIPVRITLLGGDGQRRLEFGLGSEWLVSQPEFRFQHLGTGPERVLLFIADDRSFDIHCDGLRIAEGPVPQGKGWAGSRIAVSPQLAVFGDLMVFKAAVWRLDAASAARLRDALAWPGLALPGALVQAGDAAGLASLCRNHDGLRISGSSEALGKLGQNAVALADQGRDFHARRIAERLPEESGRALLTRIDAACGKPIVTVRDLVVELEKNPTLERRIYRRIMRRRDTFRVVDSVNFELYHGDVLGIIGHNGAGKSTLLRALCGLISIKQGRIEISDRFLLLRPGMGMREELTGRENIMSMGFYLGLSLDEIEALSADIISFSELGEHIDKSVKYYSDGMRARLSFSIATSFAPEVVFLDELLGAGDISFQEKAQARLRNYMKRVGTVVVVTHSMGFVQESCTKALLMHQGRQVHFGDPQEAIARYLMLMEK